MVWDYQDDEHRPLLEIFQGFRDRAIESDAHEGLDRGYHFGFIASSDHLSTRASYAGVWADERSRESLFTAMKSRRTFGATDKIVLAVRCGDRWMGEQISAAEMPPLEIHIEGTAPVRSIDVIVDGQVQQTLTPLQRELDITVPLSLTGQHYVYVRLQQSDGNQAWSSPIWVDIAEANGAASLRRKEIEVTIESTGRTTMLRRRLGGMTQGHDSWGKTLIWGKRLIGKRACNPSCSVRAP